LSEYHIYFTGPIPTALQYRTSTNRHATIFNKLPHLYNTRNPLKFGFPVKYFLEERGEFRNECYALTGRQKDLGGRASVQNYKGRAVAYSHVLESPQEEWRGKNILHLLTTRMHIPLFFLLLDTWKVILSSISFIPQWHNL
jgi:hypothetical protein